MSRAKWVATVFVVLAFAVPGMANIVGPGEGALPDSLVGSSGPFLANTGVLPYSSATLSGLYQEMVFTTGVTPVCPAGDCIGFQLQVSNDTTSGYTIPAVNLGDLFGLMGSFVGFLTDIGIDSNMPASLPGCTATNAELSAGGSRSPITGTEVSWGFLGIATGSCSTTLIVETNAHSFEPGPIGIVALPPSGGMSIGTLVTGFAPSVPEPPSFLLIATALAAIALVRHKLARLTVSGVRPDVRPYRSFVFPDADVVRWRINQTVEDRSIFRVEDRARRRTFAAQDAASLSAVDILDLV